MQENVQTEFEKKKSERVHLLEWGVKGCIY